MVILQPLCITHTLINMHTHTPVYTHLHIIQTIVRRKEYIEYFFLNLCI